MNDNERREVCEVLAPFVDFLDWVDAAVVLGEIDPVGDQDSVVHLNLGGGSVYLRVSQFRAARAVLMKYHPADREGGHSK